MGDDAIHIQLAPRARLNKATAACFGLTDKAIRRKIEEGKWLAGREYHRDPDGNIWLDVKGIMQWVAGEAVSKSGRTASGSRSQSTADTTARQ